MESQPTDKPKVEDTDETSIAVGEETTTLSPLEHKRLIRRIDRRLIIMLGCLYSISILDRGNLGAASVAGMQTELKMDASNSGYSIISLVFFVSYTIFQIFSTVIIRKVGPRIFLSVIAFLWGVITMTIGFAPNWRTLAGLRVILGALDAGCYPGCVYLLSTWYPRYELHKRVAVFSVIGALAGAFGGILAYGISQMDGVAGKSGWRWIFILEGSFTCVFGAGSYIALVDFPEQSPKSWNFLTEAEAAYIVASIEKDRSDVFAGGFSIKKYLSNCRDSKVWAYAVMFMLTTTTTYSISYFLPIILQHSMGFSVVMAQCLVAPPQVFGCIVMYIQGVCSDRWRIRGPFVAGNALMGVLGLGLVGFLDLPAPRYFGTFLASAAGSANVAILVSWQSNNIRGQWKRALTSATLIGGGGIGGIVSTTVFRAQDAPDYRPGLVTAMVGNAVVVLIVGALTVKFYRANKRVDAGGKPIEGLPGFKYTY